MHERVEGVGAQLSITSQPGGGTKLIIRWAPVHFTGENHQERV
jgi:signal transduction histidine kinase